MPKGIHSTPEFRARACNQVLQHSRPTREVADEMGIRPDTLRTWLQRQRAEGIEMAKAEETDQEAKIRELEADLAKAKDDLYWAGQENEFLKKAAGFFAADHKPKRGSK